MNRRVVIAIANQKGGVGKTTTAVNLGAGLARRGFRTLVVDLDIQCNSTHVLYRELTETEDGLCECILDEKKIDSIVKPTTTANLFVAPAGESLVHADLNLAGMMGRDSILRGCLDSDELRRFHFVIIDTSPYLGLLTINALVATDFVVIPVSCEFLPLLGIKWLLRTILQVKSKLHPTLDTLGYLLTMYDRRESITRDVEDILRDQFGDAVFDSRIRVNTKHKAAPAEHKTIYEYENSTAGRGSLDYSKFTDEFLERLAKRLGVALDVPPVKPAATSRAHTAAEPVSVPADPAGSDDDPAATPVGVVPPSLAGSPLETAAVLPEPDPAVEQGAPADVPPAPQTLTAGAATTVAPEPVPAETSSETGSLATPATGVAREPDPGS